METEIIPETGTLTEAMTDTPETGTQNLTEAMKDTGAMKETVTGTDIMTDKGAMRWKDPLQTPDDLKSGKGTGTGQRAEGTTDTEREEMTGTPPQAETWTGPAGNNSSSTCRTKDRPEACLTHLTHHLP